MDLNEDDLELWIERSRNIKTIETLADKLSKKHPLRQQAYYKIHAFYKERNEKIKYHREALRVAAMLNTSRCWYTNERLNIISKSPWRVTVEHVHPRSLGGKNNDNVVVAAYWINNFIGNAPVIVKENIRHQLFSLDVTNLSAEEKLEVYKEKTKNILMSYYIDDVKQPPWELIRTRPVIKPNYNQYQYNNRLNTMRAYNRIALIERLGEVAWI